MKMIKWTWDLAKIVNRNYDGLFNKVRAFVTILSMVEKDK